MYRYFVRTRYRYIKKTRKFLRNKENFLKQRIIKLTKQNQPETIRSPGTTGANQTRTSDNQTQPVRPDPTKPNQIQPNHDSPTKFQTDPNKPKKI
jgi:hypothetical protein